MVFLAHHLAVVSQKAHIYPHEEEDDEDKEEDDEDEDDKDEDDEDREQLSWVAGERLVCRPPNVSVQGTIMDEHSHNTIQRTQNQLN